MAVEEPAFETVLSDDGFELRDYARQQKWPLERVEVRLTHAKGGVEEKSAKTDHFAKTLRISGKELTEEQRDKLIAVAARCPL